MATAHIISLDFIAHAKKRLSQLGSLAHFVHWATMDSGSLQERQVLRRRVIACYVHLGCRSMNGLEARLHDVCRAG